MAFWRKRYTSKHTGKEIDDAVDAVGQLPDNVMGNPMTAAGDLIVGGTDGEPEKLAAGTSGQVLKIGTTGPEWSSDAEGMANPMTAAGDLIVGGADGAPARLAKGTEGQVLKMNAGATAPEWASDAEGMANPMTAAGDIIVGGVDGAPGRLAKGSAGQVLKMNAGATAPEWAADSEGMANPMTAAGDIIIGGTDGAPARLAKGTDGQVLSMVSGAPTWAAAGGGGKYRHNIYFQGSYSSTNLGGTVTVHVAFNFINDVSSGYTTKTNLVSFLKTLGTTQSKEFTASGCYVSSTYITNSNTLSVYYSSNAPRVSVSITEMKVETDSITLIRLSSIQLDNITFTDVYDYVESL